MAELVEAAECLLAALTCYLLALEQGCLGKDSAIPCSNKLVMLLEKMSSDHAAREWGARVLGISAPKKSLQGNLFRKFRETVSGHRLSISHAHHQMLSDQRSMFAEISAYPILSDSQAWLITTSERAKPTLELFCGKIRLEPKIAHETRSRNECRVCNSRACFSSLFNR